MNTLRCQVFSVSLYILLALDDKSHGASFCFYFERCFIATHETADTSREVPLSAPFIARDHTHWSGFANSKKLSHFICTLHSRLRNS